jgi:hypothetical protein
MARASNNDFNPDDLTKKSDEHDKLLGALEKRVGTNENFGKTFKSAASDSKSIDEAVGRIVVELLQSDTKSKEAIESIVKKLDNREMKKQLWGLSKVVLWIISLIITAAVTAWVS